MEKKLNVLLVEDNPDDADLLVHRLRHEGYQVQFQRVETQDQFISALQSNPDIILADWNLPNFSGLQALHIKGEQQIDIPFIIISGSIGEESAVQAMRMGANDYLLKDRPERLGQAIFNALEQKKLRNQKYQDEEILQFQADLLENVHDAIYALDHQMVFTYWNRTAQTIFGFAVEEVIGQQEQAILHTESINIPYDQIFHQLQQKNDIRVNLLQQNKEGHTFFIESNIKTLRDKQGKISGYVFANRDITKRKIAEESLAISEAKYREFINASVDIFILKDHNLRIIMCNKALQRFLDKTEDDILFKTDIDLFPQEVAIQSELNDKEVLQHQQIIITNENIAGQIFEIHKFPVPLGNQLGVGTYWQNITEKRKAETTLLLQAAALDSAANAIAITDNQGNIEWINPAFSDLTGYSFEESIGKSMTSLVNSGRQDAVFYKNMLATIQSGNTWRGELINRKKDGSLYTEEQTITPFFNQDNQIQQYVAIKQDVTEKKRIENDLQQKTIEYQFLAAAALRLPTMKTEDEVFSYIKESIPIIAPNTFSVVMRFTPDGKLLFVDDILGIDMKIIRKAIKVIGVDLEHKKFEVIDQFQEIFSKTRLHQYPGGLPAFADTEMPPIIAKQVEKILSIHEIYSIGISGQRINFGGIHFFTRGKNNFINQSLVESFFRQCYLALARIHTQKELSDSEQQFRQLAENIHEAFWLVEADSGNFIYISPAFEEIWKIKDTEIYQNPYIFQKKVHPAYRDSIVNAINTLRTNGIPLDIEHPILLPDGSSRWIHTRAYPVYDENNKLIRIAGIAEDISERVLSIETLRQNHERLNRAEQVSLSGYWEFNMETQYVDASQGARQIYGLGDHNWKISEVQKLPLVQYRAMLDKAMADLINHNKPYDVEFKIHRPVDQKIVAIHSVAEYDPARKVIFGIIQDISTRKEAEEALVEVAKELRFAYDATIEGWSRAMDLRDKETEGHTQRVTEITLDLARKVGINGDALIHIRRGALLHDIGKIGVPDSILLKPGPLTDSEWETMRKHPEYAYEMLSMVDYLHPALDIPYCHHEHWDGEGYPRKLKGEQIPLAARIFTIIDVWDALISDRPYRKAWSKEKAYHYMQEQSGVLFDPQILNIFLSTIKLK